LRGHEDNDTAGLEGGEGEKEVDRSIMPRKEVLEALTANVVAAVRTTIGIKGVLPEHAGWVERGEHRAALGGNEWARR
jgi:hypothetical protein